jgi:predicted metalloprotease with PDZ domain
MRHTGFSRSCLSIIVLVCVAFTATVMAAQEVRHTLSYPQHREQYFLVRSEFPVAASVTDVIMPNWAPGSYRIREFAANVDKISAVSASGQDLVVSKTSKDRWRIRTEGVSTLIVDYEVFTPDLAVNSSWASRSFSLVNGASVFLYTEASRYLPQTLSIETDRERGGVFTAMPETAGGAAFMAANYDELVDNPVAVADAPAYRFEHDGQGYVFVNVGENGFWDGSKASGDVEKIVRETQSFWRQNPLQRPYWFLNFAVEGRGGLEHDYSTVIMTGRRQMQDREAYIKWLSVVAHEFFHVWNVRNMRPAALAEYDYQNEQYTSQLWLAEGLTSYYDNLLLSRAGLIKPDEYMELLAKDIHRLENTPGRKLRPVTEASLDAWIRHYQPNSNSVNSTISYYTKGAVIGFVLDTHLRKKSKGRKSLDDVMRGMFERYSNNPYTSDNFAQVVVEVGGADALEFLNPLLSTTIDPDVDSALDWFGLKLNREPIANDLKSDSVTVESGFGAIWDDKHANLIVKAVLAGSSGAKSGLLPGDEVLAIGGERLTKSGLTSLMTSFEPGEKTTLLVARRGKIMTLDVELETAIPDRFDIVVQSGFGKRHINRLRKLLGQNLQQK